MIFELIKILYDKYGRYLKFIVSGSSSLELLDKTAETLAGRVEILRAYPFSMSEASVYERIDDFSCAESLYGGIFSGSLTAKNYLTLSKSLNRKAARRHN